MCSDRKQTSGYLGGVEREVNFGAWEYVHYLDCGKGFTHVRASQTVYFKDIQLTVCQSYLSKAINGRCIAAQYGTGCTRILPKFTDTSNETSFPKGEARCPTDYSSAKILISPRPSGNQAERQGPGPAASSCRQPPSFTRVGTLSFRSRGMKKIWSKCL